MMSASQMPKHCRAIPENKLMLLSAASYSPSCSSGEPPMQALRLLEFLENAVPSSGSSGCFAFGIAGAF